MRSCSICGGTGGWLSLNENNICPACASGVPADHGPLELRCKHKTTLIVDGGTLVILQKGSSSTIPISNIQDITIELPKNLSSGSVTISTSKASSGFVSIGGGLSLGLGSSVTVYPESNAEITFAKKIRDYVINFHSTTQAPSASSDSVVDELMKLKSLLDAGAITQEEFDSAKRKLLL